MGIISNKHSDVWVPKKISRKFGLNFSVSNSTGPLPGWFISQLSSNVTGARVLPKTNSIFYKLINDDDAFKYQR